MTGLCDRTITPVMGYLRFWVLVGRYLARQLVVARVAGVRHTPSLPSLPEQRTLAGG
jgi:hypothetical protein